MKFDENKTFAEIAIGEAIDNPTVTLCRQTEPIIEFLLKHLDIEFSAFSPDKKELLQKNFIYIMCLILNDLKDIENRIEQYNGEFKKLNGDKSNKAEYQRRKIEYFCKMNQEARIEIIKFLNNGLKEYLLENMFDALKRDEDNDELTKLFMNRRYRYAHFKEYYEMSYDYTTCVRYSYLPGVKLEDILKTEKYYLDLKKSNPQEYVSRMHKLVENEHIMQNIEYRVSKNYHLCKRKEIFENMTALFNRGNYQSFLALGLLQLEGMFYDFCLIKFGDQENMGTLVEKAQKSLDGGNGYRFIRFYPYFAFDVPIMRNEIAHKGMMESTDVEEAAYNLVLDLNTVSAMVKEESYDKFIVFLMTHEEMIKLNSDTPESLEFNIKVNRTLILELLRNSVVANDYFWKVLKSPLDYEEELNFYAQDDLPEGYIDLKGIVSGIATLLRQDGFWSALYDEVNEYVEKSEEIPKTLYDFVKRMKNDYISELNGKAKEACIKLTKIIK